jgi:hypothetical protein
VRPLLIFLWMMELVEQPLALRIHNTIDRFVGQIRGAWTTIDRSSSTVMVGFLRFEDRTIL